MPNRAEIFPEILSPLAPLSNLATPSTLPGRPICAKEFYFRRWIHWYCKQVFLVVTQSPELRNAPYMSNFQNTISFIQSFKVLILFCSRCLLRSTHFTLKTKIRPSPHLFVVGSSALSITNKRPLESFKHSLYAFRIVFIVLGICSRINVKVGQLSNNTLQFSLSATSIVPSPFIAKCIGTHNRVSDNPLRPPKTPYHKIQHLYRHTFFQILQHTLDEEQFCMFNGTMAYEKLNIFNFNDM